MFYECYGDLTTLRGMLNKAATDTADDARLRVVMEAVTRLIDNHCRRHFALRTEARKFGEEGVYTRKHQLWVPDFLAITSIVCDYNSDGTRETTLQATEYLLWPTNSYPKFRIDLNLPVPPTYSYWPTTQEAIAITGLWGYGDGDSATPWTPSGSTLTVATTDGTTVAAVSGAAFAVGQTIRCGSEDMYITGISTNNLTVVRGVNGTTGAAHNAAASSIHQIPATVREACLLQTARLFSRKSALYGVVGGSEMGQIVIPTKLDPDVALLLRDYVSS